MTKKKEKIEPVETITTEPSKEVVVEQPKKEVVNQQLKEQPKVEPKKEPIKPIISDVEVAKKLVNIHSSAQSRSLEFNLTFEYVKKLLEYNTCYYTNVIFTEEGGSARSFDRVDNDKVNNKDNFHLACLDCNLKRRRKTDEKFLFTKQLNIIKQN